MSSNSITARVDIGDVSVTFILNDKGKANADSEGNKNNKLQLLLRYKNGKLLAGLTKFIVTLKNGDFRQPMNDLGLVNDDVKDETIFAPVIVTLAGDANIGFLEGNYKAKKNKNGMLMAK